MLSALSVMLPLVTLPAETEFSVAEMRWALNGAGHPISPRLLAFALLHSLVLEKQ